MAPSSKTRRLSISDILILIAALAVGTIILRAYWPDLAFLLADILPTTGDPWGLWRFYYGAHGPGSCLAVPAMAALILIRLQRPRPRRSRLMGQPGFVACLAVMASLVPGLLRLATIYHSLRSNPERGFEQVWATATYWADTAVLGGWTALALARRWRPEASWIDRAGIALGLFWMLMLLTAMAAQWVSKILAILYPGGVP